MGPERPHLWLETAAKELNDGRQEQLTETDLA
jgi:hypothetical protein